MFGWFFKKKTDREKLDLQYKRLMIRHYELQDKDPAASIAAYDEAEMVSKMIDDIDLKAKEGVSL